MLKRAPRAHDAPSPFANAIGRAAIGALHDELALDPKPGLVSPVDRGSHDDMDAATFFRSLFALRRYVADIAAAGERLATFGELEALGIAAERRMLAATGGVNTHRGAVFTLGLLCAAAGAASSVRSRDIREALDRHWGDALRARARVGHDGLRSAGVEAALGMPTLFDHAWPALVDARRAGLDTRRCRLQAFFASLAELDDTNLVRRGGIDGLRFARATARSFNAAGGAFHADALDRARQVRDAFVARRLSPGGSADVLAAACWLDRLATCGGSH